MSFAFDSGIISNGIMSQIEDQCCTSTGEASKSVSLRIFLSYGHDEYSEFTQKLADDLIGRGHAVWFDRNKLKLGVDWEIYIEEGLKWVAELPGNGGVVLVMTPHSVRRPDGFCLNEIARALDYRLFIVPVMLVRCTPPLSISRIQWLDMQFCSSLPLPEKRYESSLYLLINSLQQRDLAIEGQNALLRRYLNPLSFEADIVHHQKWFVGRDWVFQDIEAWLNTTDSVRLYWITGLPGIGKTAIATCLIQRMENLVAFHLCRRGNSDKSSPAMAIKSIAYQLSTQLPDYAEKLAATELSQLDLVKDAGRLFDSLLVQPLAKDIKRPKSARVILIDGLDEATNDGQNLLAEFIAEYFHKLPDWLRIIITSRPDQEVTVPLQEWDRWTLEAADSRNQQDIENYIQTMLGPQFPDKIPKQLISAISAKSEGIFLYAEWVCREIIAGRLPLDDYDGFPKGLGGIYSGYFKHKLRASMSYPEGIAYFSKNIRPTLELVLAAREPLQFKMIAQWLRLSRYDEEEFFKSLGSLFFLDLHECIKPFHSSVLDWLSDSRRSGEFFVDPEEGNTQICGFLWEEYTELHPSGFSKYALRHLANHLIKEKRWDDLVALLCDLDYIQEKAAAKLTHELMAEYNSALNKIPDNAPVVQEALGRRKRMERYARDLIACAEGSIVLSELDIPKSVEIWTDEEILQEVERINDNPSNLDVLRDFSNYVGHEASNLQRFSTGIPNFAYQQAWNYTSGGYVGESAARLKTRDISLLFTKSETSRPIYNPLPQILKVFKWRSSQITSVCFTPDGTKMLSGSWDMACVLWDVESGDTLFKLRGHSRCVHAVSMTPDGRLAVSGSLDNTCILWDLTKGTPIRTLSGHKNWVMDVDITPDGKRAISGSHDKKCILWDLDSGKIIHILEGHKGWVTSVKITPDGKYGASGSFDRTVILWDLERGVKLKQLRGHHGSVETVSITPDGKWLVSGSEDQTCILWDLEYGQIIHTLSGHSDKVLAVSITPDGKKALSGARDNTCLLWDLMRGQLVRTLMGHTFWVESVQIAPDGKWAVSGSTDQSCILWDLEKGMRTRVMEPHKDWIESGCVAFDRKTAITGSRDHTCKVWDLQRGVVINTLNGHTKGVEIVATTPDGTRAISGSEDNSCMVWDLGNHSANRTLIGHTKGVLSLSISQSGKFAISGSRDRTCAVWNLATGEQCGSLEGHQEAIYSVCITPDGKRAITGSSDHTCRVWDWASGEVKHTLRGHSNGVLGVCVTPNGKNAVSYSMDKTWILWDLNRGELLRKHRLHTDTVYAIAVTPDGKRVLTCSRDRTCVIWDIQSGEPFLQIPITGFASMVGGIGIVTGLGERRITYYNASRKSLCPSTPIVTARYLWDFCEHKYLPRVADCPICGHRFPPEQKVIDTIHKIAEEVGLAPKESACLTLPDVVYDNPGLLSKCPSCKEKIRFNPFFPEEL